MKVRTVNSFPRETFLFKRWLLAFVFCFLAINIAFGQTKTITGTVIDDLKEPLPSANVIIKGTTTGTITDFDGNYSISAKSGDVLVFSFIGLSSKEVIVGSSNTINVELEMESNLIGESVVIGYGSAKAKDLTSPIATIKGDEVTKHLTSSPMQAMQGKIPGLQVINTGQPGSSPKVRIRGVGNYDSDKQGPLYVVDGMFFDNIDFLSNGDIENISVLKDASAAAIYGVRAANGVILVTTKKGVKNRPVQVTYDGYFGIQKASNVVKMANSEQYATIMKEMGELGTVNSSIDKYGGADGIPAVNTDWYKEVLEVAPMHNHSISLTGGGDKTAYSLGLSYLNQDGIVKGKNGYERINIRTKVDVQVTDWLKTGGNVVIVSSNQQLANGSVLGNAYTSPSIYPVYDENNADATPVKFASAQNIGLTNYYWNPVAIAHYHNESARIAQVLPSYFVELSFLDSRLTFKSSFSQDLAIQRNQTKSPTYTVSASQQNPISRLTKRQQYTNNWLIDNIATYRDEFNDKHNFTFMVGNSVRKERLEHIRLIADNIPEGRDEYWYIHNGILQAPNVSKDSPNDWIDNASEYRGASFFGRMMYDYKGKYLLSATFRADGSSKYQEKWGYFPSIGLGWNITEEDFMKDQKVVNHLKLRGSWGLLGNDKIQANDGFASTTVENGFFNNQIIQGSSSLSFFSSLKWERVEEWDFGLDFITLNNRLSGELDYFKRTTKEAVFRKQLSFGAPALLVNNGEIVNSGVEVTLNWNDKINKDFSYNIGLNASTLKNEVTSLDGLNRIITGGDYDRVRQIGEVMDAYYGYVMTGIYQNQAEIDNDPTIADIKDKPVPGDIKYKDVNGDGKLTADDRTVIGSPLPKFFLGGSIGFNYKQFDFSTAFQGQFGHKILNMKRFMRQKQPDINFDNNIVVNRWKGEGSTNNYMSGAGLGHTWNYSRFNTFFVENANTFTIQNIQLGYTFANVLKSNNKSSLRVSFTAERPFSFFTYNGFTTDIADGIDSNMYPLTSTYSVGVRLTY